MTTVARLWRLQIHESGVGSPSGDSVEFSFSDEVKAPPAVGGQTVRPLEGRAESTPWQVEVVDAASVFTAAIGSSGRGALMQRFADIAYSDDGGTGWTTLATGRVSDIALTDVATYTVSVSDERIVERSTTIFAGSGSTATMWLPGFASGSYGPFENRPDFTKGGATRAFLDRKSRSGNLTFVEVSPSTSGGVVPLTVARSIEEDLLPEAPEEIDYTATSGSFRHLRLHTIDDDTDWEIAAIGNLLDVSVHPLPSSDRPVSLSYIQVVDTGNTFADGDGYLYMATGDPTDEMPLHIEERPADLLADIYSGVYSDGQTVRFDPAAITALQSRLQADGVGTLRWRIKGPENMARWLEDNIYQPLGIVPLIDAAGRVKPVKLYPTTTEISNPTTLYEFTEANSQLKSWRHASDEMVTVVRGRYLSETQHRRQALFVEGEAAYDLIIENEEEVEEELSLTPGAAPITAEFRRVHELNLSGWHAKDEATSVTRLRSREIFEMFGDGPLRASLRAVSTDSPTTMPDAGDYVLVNHSAMPSFTGLRGSTRVMLALSRTALPVGYDYDLIEIGPSSQPLAAPTITVATGDNIHQVIVSVSNLATDAEWEIQAARSTTEPAATSGLWRTVYVADNDDASVAVSHLRSGATFWFRARARHPRRIPSDWSTAVSITTGTIPAPTNFTITNNNHATLLGIAWTNRSTFYGVDVLLNGTRVARLPGGSTEYNLTGLEASTEYNAPGVQVRHVGPWGGVGTATAGLSFTTLATDPTAEQPQMLMVVRGRLVIQRSATP